MKRISQLTSEDSTLFEADESFDSLLVNVGVERHQYETQEWTPAERKTIPIENLLGHEEVVMSPSVLDCPATKKVERRVAFTDLGRVRNEPQEVQSASPGIGKSPKRVRMKLMKIVIPNKKVPPKIMKKPKPLKITARKCSDFSAKTVKKADDLCKPVDTPIPLSGKNPLDNSSISSPKLHSQQTKVHSKVHFNTTNEFGQLAKEIMDQTKISLEQIDQNEANLSSEKWDSFDMDLLNKTGNRDSDDGEISLQKKNQLPYNGSSGSEEDEGRTIIIHRAEVHLNASKVLSSCVGIVEKRNLNKVDKIRKSEQFDRIEEIFVNRVENILPKPPAASQDMNSLFDKIHNEYLGAKKIPKPTQKQNTRRPYNATHYSYLEQSIGNCDSKVDSSIRTAEKKALPTELKKRKLEFDIDKTLIEIDQNQADIIPVRSEKNKPTEKSQLEIKKADVDLSILCPDKCDKIVDPIIVNCVRPANAKSVEPEAVKVDDLHFNAISSATKNNDVEPLDNTDIDVSSATNKKVGFRDVSKAINEFSSRINALRNVFLTFEKRALQVHQFESPTDGQMEVVENVEERQKATSGFQIELDQEVFGSALKLISSGVNMVSSGVASLASNLEIREA